MITYLTGNILESKSYALVNPVNCVGVMGKGLALAFKEKYPNNFLLYERLCAHNAMKIGIMFVVPCDGKLIINFPTKRHWRQPSYYAYIVAGLKDLKRVITNWEIPSISIPLLGCGNGGLTPSIIKEFYTEYLGNLNTEIYIYELYF